MTEAERIAARKELFGDEWRSVGLRLTDEELERKLQGRENRRRYWARVFPSRRKEERYWWND